MIDVRDFDIRTWKRKMSQSDGDGDNHSVDDPGHDRPAIDYRLKKRRIAGMLLAYSALLGIISTFLPEEDTPSSLVFGLPVLILGVWWCFTDAAERDYRVGEFTKFLLILFFTIGLPTYMFQTRGIGAFKSLALTVLFAAAMYACMFVAAFVTLIAGSVTGLWQIEY